MSGMTMSAGASLVRVHPLYIQNENAVFLFCCLLRMDNHTVQPNLYNEGRKVDRNIRKKEKSV